MKKETLNKLGVLNDNEIEAGVWVFGAWYYVRTPTFHYTGRLVGASASVLILEDAATLFETGPYKTFFSGKRKGKNEQVHEGSGDLMVDRAGCHAMLMPLAKEK